jgi:aminomethyltransferase
MGGERDFIGKDSLQRLPRNRQMVGLKLIDRGVLRAHQPVASEQGEGEITSGGFSPTLNASIALARVPNGVQPGDRVEVMIRDRGHVAEVVKYPFVRHGRALT